MGRYRQNFSLYPRRVNGKIIWYYRTYSPEGKRTTGKSTGCTSRTKACGFCENLIKQNKLFAGVNLTFGMYASKWFDEDSSWFKEKQKLATNDKPFSKNTLLLYNQLLTKRILPFFFDIRLKDITPEKIRQFRDKLLSEKLATSTITITLYILKMILTVAYKEGKIVNNPIAVISNPRKTTKSHDAFSVDEVKKIITTSKGTMRKICLIAALTGMRKGEIFGLDPESIKDGYINLTHQLQNGENTTLKTKNMRKIPICSGLSKILLQLCEGKDKNEHILKNMTRISNDFKAVLYQAEISDIDDRNLSFHSWRHFFNTYMASRKVDARIIAAVSGHSTGLTSVQSVYINFKVEDYKDIVKEQERLLKLLFS